MLGRVLAVALLTSLTALPLLPQCNQSPVLSDPFRLTMFDIAVDGNDLWAATSYGLALYDRSAEPPRLLASLAIPGSTRIVRVSGGFAYAGSGSELVVARKGSRGLEIVRSVDTGAAINDMIPTTRSLFVATRNGIEQYDLLDPANPSKTAASFSTSQSSVVSLALAGDILYAADSDGSVESFDITTLQPSGTLTLTGAVTAVHANNGRLYVSSPVKTTIFIGTTSAGSYGLTTTAMAPIAGDAIFIASGDRTLRGIDAAKPAATLDIFRDDLPATAGNVNRINALVTAGSRLYAAAGDIGLVSYDIAGFAPFPMNGLPFAGGSSAVSLESQFYVGRDSGVTEFSQSLVQKRSWDGSRADVVHDGADGFLLTSSGQSLTLWTLKSAIPQPVASASLPAAVTGAILIGTTTGYAVLADRTLYSIDFTQAAPVPQKVSVPMSSSSIARSGSAFVFADPRSDGTTQLVYFSSPEATPETSTVEGLPASAVTLSGTTAAVQTFRGISLVDFASHTTDLLPGSNDLVARQLFATGTTLLELTSSTLRVWNTRTGLVTAEVRLPSDAVAVSAADGSAIANVVTANDVLTIALDRLVRMPLRDLPPNGNAYYRKVAASSSRVYLAHGGGVDIFSPWMQYAGSIHAAGIVAIAATEAGLFTLGGNMTLSAYSIGGTPSGSLRIDEGSDAQALGIAAVDGALWVSLIRGCTSGACEEKTLVFDSHLSQTASMSGGIVDVAVEGNLAAAITDLPSELRLLDVSDPLHPSPISSVALQNGPVSVAWSAGTIYVLGDTLRAYATPSLTKTADLLGPYSSDGSVTYVDQHVRIDGACAVITGRTSSPQRYALPQWTPAPSPPTPAPARAIATAAGRTYVLTDQSLEIWSDTAPGTPPRRRATR